MNGDQLIFLATLPFVLAAQCVNAVTAILRDLPNEVVTRFRYLGQRD